MNHNPIWLDRLKRVLSFQAPVLITLGLTLFIPFGVAIVEARGMPNKTETATFLIPAFVALIIGLLIDRQKLTIKHLSANDALLITTASWLIAGLLGATPFVILLNTPIVDALLESISGFTTAGTTMLTGLDTMPRSILVWRALMQWLGGLGILLIILLVGQTSGNQGLHLLSAEGVKVSSGRLSLNFQRAAYRFTIIYATLTLSQIILTTILGMPLFDSILHAMTTISTGGFSPHDESIAFYRNRPGMFPNFVAIELTLVVFMLASGINFYILYRLARGQLSALWDGLEMRLVWVVVGVATLIITLNTFSIFNGSLADWFTRSLFLVTSVVSTTGFETTATGAFPRLSREIILLLMLLGGGAGSTAGGIKLIRLGVLGKFLSHEIRQLRLPRHAVHLPFIDGHPVSNQAFRQAVFVLLLWLVYIAIGGLIISLNAPDIPIADAYSTVFSAIGVYGPSFLSVAEVIAFPDISKIIITLGMLAGRLEILPLLVFFNPNAWRSSR